MARNDFSLELQLQRPVGIPRGRWLDVLIDACCTRTIPHLKAFSVGPDEGWMQMCIPGSRSGDSSPLDTCFGAVAAVLAQLDEACPRPDIHMSIDRGAARSNDLASDEAGLANRFQPLASSERQRAIEHALEGRSIVMAPPDCGA